MTRVLFESLEAIKYAAEDIRREQSNWHELREAQKLRWRLDPATTTADPDGDAQQKSRFSEQLDRIYNRYR